MYDVERIEDLSRFAALRQEWDDLLATSPANCLFLTWEWLYTWWKHLGGRRRLHLFLVRNRGELAGIAPLAQRPPILRRLLPFPALEFLGTGTVGSDHLDVIAGSGKEHPVSEALASAWDGTSLALELAQVNRTASLAAALVHRLEHRGWAFRDSATELCPVIDLAGHSWESYVGTLGSAHRYNFQRRLRNLEKRFKTRLELAHTEAERRLALETLVALHTHRWDARGGSDAFGSRALLSFHDEVTQLALERGWLRLFVLRLDGKPAAALLGYRYGQTFSFYQSGFDPAFAKDSVGLVMMGLAIRWAIEEGATEYDFLHGAEPYKFHWMPAVRELARYDLFPPGIRGAVCQRIAIASGRIRRTARQLLGVPVADRIGSRGFVGALSTARRPGKH